MWLHLLFIALGGAALWRGADWLVEGASRLARRFGLSDIVIGLTVVAIGTSAPEFAVTLTAALEGKAAVSLGNIVGSNIFNLGLILGGVALFGTMPIARALVLRDGAILLAAACLLLFFAADGVLGRWEGGILLAGLIAYLILVLRQRKESALSEEVAEEVIVDDFHIADLGRLLGGLVTVIAGAYYLVEHATQLATLLGLSEWLIGITIVAIGTSLPELATSAVAAARGRLGLSAGNLIGSDLFNVLGVLGVTAALNPLAISADSYPGLLMMCGQIALLLVLLRTGWQLSRREGLLLVVCGLARWGASFV